MQIPNEHGCYRNEIVEEVARAGRASAEVRLCQCDDTLWRFAIAYEVGTSGCSGPISKLTPGYTTMAGARTAAMEELVRRFGRWLVNARSEEIYPEIATLLARLKARLGQPSLLDLLT